MAPHVDRGRRPDRRAEEEERRAAELPGRPPVRRRRVDEGHDPRHPDREAGELGAGGRRPQDEDLDHGDPERHGVDEDRRAPRRDDLERDVHEGRSCGDLAEPDAQDDREVAPRRQGEPPPEDHEDDDRREAAAHAERGVRERRHVVEAPLRHHPVDAPDERQEGEEDGCRAAAMGLGDRRVDVRRPRGGAVGRARARGARRGRDRRRRRGGQLPGPKRTSSQPSSGDDRAGSAPRRRAGEPGASAGSGAAPGARAKGRSFRDPSW